MKKINTPIDIKDLGKKFLTSDIWFICETNKFQKVIKPQRYKKDILGKNIKEFELKIKEYFPYHEKETSFINASIYNATTKHTPDNILQSKNYTYYFKLTPTEIKKCLFELTLNGDKLYSKGLKGFTEFYQTWFEINNSINKNREGFIDRPQDNIQMYIPFKIKPLYYVPNYENRIYYHGSIHRFKELKKYSYVTPYKEDAIKFAIPWDSNDLLIKDENMSSLGRPPKNLLFKRKSNINDCTIYLYSIKGIKTISALTNTGKSYPWNRITLESSFEENKSLKLERKILSWKKELYNF